MSINDYGVIFNGRRIVHPGAYSAIDTNKLLMTTLGSTNRPIYVGESDSGVPGVVAWFSSASDARKYLRGGELYDMLDLGFSPSPEGGGGASLIGVLPTNALLKAGIAVGGMTIDSVEYGTGGNRVAIKLEDGTVLGSKLCTITRWDLGITEIFNNLGAMMSIQYTGGDAYAGITVAVDGVSKEATSLVIKTGADVGTATIDVTVNLADAQYSTITQLAKYLSSIDGYSVVYSDNLLPSSSLDPVVAADIKTAPYDILAVSQDIPNQINKISSLVRIASIAFGAAITNFASTVLTGGATGASPASWTPYFDTVAEEFSDILCVLSSSNTIHAEAESHVSLMEGRGQRKVAFVGGSLSESVTDTKRRASFLNSSRVVLAYPGIYIKDSTTELTKLVPPYFTAALLAGRASGVDPSEPLTFDYFNLIALEKNLLSGSSDVDDLMTSGVATLENVYGGGIRLAQSITTDLEIGSPFRELSLRRGSDALSDKITRSLEATFVGRKGVPVNITTIALATKSILTEAVANEEITAFRNITVTFSGSVVKVDYDVAYIEPINFILITSHFVRDI